MAHHAADIRDRSDAIDVLRTIDTNLSWLRNLKRTKSRFLILAHNSSDRSSVVLKIVPKEAPISEHQHFLQRHFAARQFNHPNIVRCLEVHSIEDGVTYVRMEAVKGSDLETLLNIHSRFSEDEALAIVRGVLTGLEAIHEQDIVHCGIHPSNIMIANQAPFIKLINFSFAHSVGEKIARSMQQDPAYLAPEQLLEGKNATRAIDIWAVGILLYHMISGEFPFQTSDRMEDVMQWIKVGEPQDLSEELHISSSTVFLYKRALSKDPMLRPAHADEMLVFIEPDRNQKGEELVETADAQLQNMEKRLLAMRMARMRIHQVLVEEKAKLENMFRRLSKISVFNEDANISLTNSQLSERIA